MPRLTSFLVAVALVGAPLSYAATVVVAKDGALTTIQAGVNAALAGDTVLVESGVYQENVTIAAGKTGLRLIAAGKVIVEARKANGAGGGPGITVLSDEVLVKGLTIRNALESSTNAKNGDGIRVLAADFTGQALTIAGCANTGVLVQAVARASIRSCSISGSAIGVRANAAVGLTVSKSRLRSTSTAGIELQNSIDVRISKCEFLGCLGSGAIQSIVDPCLDVVIDRCEFQNVPSSAIFIEGDEVTVSNCEFTHCSSSVQLSGNDSQIFGNRFEFLRDDAFAIGLEICDGSVIRDNEIHECSDSAILIRESFDFEVRGNTAVNCCYEGEGTVEVDDTSSGVIQSNVASDCAGSGFSIAGPNCSVIENSAKRCTLDGILVKSTATNALVDGNVIDRCGAEGLDQRATNATIRDNVFKRCRIDLTNVGTANFLGNLFKTGGVNVPFEID